MTTVGEKGRNMDIYIVDDEPKIRNGLVKLLHGRGCWTVTGVFEDAISALQELAFNQPDVIITDIKMPEINGLDMVARMRETKNNTNIIILSGYSDFAFAQRAIELGVVRYLTKPTNIKELIQLLEQLELKIGEAVKEDLDKKQVANLLVQKAIDYIRMNYSGDVSLGRIAAELYLSPNYLSELFKRYTNKNISEYINEYRLDKAKKYLIQPGYKIADVAELVGFNGYRHFSSLFKKQYGMTPLKYRNNSVK